MPILPAPETELDYIADANSNPFDPDTNPVGLGDGGHRTVFPTLMQYLVVVMDWFEDAAQDMDALAVQVAADALSASTGSGTQATVAQIRAGGNSQYISIQNVLSAQEPVALTDAASIAWDMNTGINFMVTLAGNRTLANPTNTKNGKSGFIAVTQDATGGRSITAFGTNYKWIGGLPFWTIMPAGISIITYFVKSPTEIWLTFGGNS